ncbi:MAG: hypothetical protein AAFS10_22710, partial [Myxococcota bacterium]
GDSGQPIVTDTSPSGDTALGDTAEQDTALADTSEPWPWDYPEPECTSDDDCEDDTRCFGGACVTSIDPDTYLFSGMGVVTGFHIPSAAQEPCCFDLDGDGTIDNTIAPMLDLYEDALGVDVRAQFERQLRELRQHLVVQARPTPGEEGDEDTVDLGLFVGWSDVDSDGVPDTDPAAQAEGQGVFQIDPRSLGDFGPRVGFPASSATRDDTTVAVQTTAASFATALPIGEECSWVWHTAEPLGPYARCRGEQPLPLTFSRLRVEATLRAEDNGIFTVDERLAEGDEPREVGGFKMGGYVHLDALKEILNASYGDNCQCIGLERDQDIFISGVEDGTYTLGCAEPFAENLDLSGCSEFNRSCPGIADLCQQLPLLAALAEFDSDGDGANDSVSFGMRLQLAAARIDADNPLRPPQERCGDPEGDIDGDGLPGCTDPGCWDDVNCGHEGWGEQCHDGRDNDDDGAVDCEDPQCDDNIACVEP